MDQSKITESEIKSMLFIFFDIKGIVYKEFVLVGQTVNSVYCCELLWRLRENVGRLCHEHWQQKKSLLHNDNVQPHNSFFTREFLFQNNMTCRPSPTPLA
jgi:hypothetical protein